MKNTIVKRFLMVVGITLIAAILAVPGHLWGSGSIGQKMQQLNVTLGLDLAGGTELDYRIDLTDAIAKNNDKDPTNNVNLENISESVRDALERRVNPAGVGEITVKRSEVDGQQHVLIQMPPSSSVDAAKRDAERDNRLEFFEEDPTLEDAAKASINTVLNTITPQNWDQKVAGLTIGNNNVVLQKFDEPGRWRDELPDPALADSLFAARGDIVLDQVFETQTELEYTMNESGEMTIKTMPKAVLGIVRVKSVTTENRDITTPEQVHARHILLAYPGALRAPAVLPYTSEEEARTQAQKLLERLQTEGTDNFEEIAKEFSTEPAAQQSGGDLGTFGRGQMTPAFEDAVFAQTDGGLIDHVVETDFGFHVIEVLDYSPEKVESTPEQRVSFELLGWDRSELGWQKTELGGGQLDNAMVGFDQVGGAKVDLLFNDEGGDMFAEITGRVASRRCNGNPCRLGIKVGGEWLSQPTVQEKIVGRTAQITGNFTFESAKDLADGLNLGAIDAPVVLSGQITVEPSLGLDSLNKSLKAAALGLLATILFMIFSYKFSGIVAGFALILYAAMYVAILKIVPSSLGGPIVLSLAGIAGVALSLGLAVDGNILIFERMQEELKRGRPLHQALDLGFERAWTAIRDSNLTTLITCLILYNLGSSMIKGFAITLIVGTLLSMFTAINVSRNVLHFVLLNKKFQHPKFFGVSEKDIVKNLKK